MVQLAANLSWMFKEWSFLDRFAAAADHGFTAVEYLFPYDHKPDDIAQRLSRHNLKLALFNMPPGDPGERGYASNPARQTELRASVRTALDYALATGAPRMHLMSGLVASDWVRALASYRDALNHACDAAAQHGLDIMIEPINNRDVPHYLMNDFNLAKSLITELGRPNLKLQFDIYHRQILHGDVTRGLEQLMPITGHIQISSVPDRNEPTTGELDDRRILQTIDRLNYPGFIGCEYTPATNTRDGLGWIKSLG